MIMRQASTRRLAAFCAASAMWAAACGSTATTGDSPTTGTGNDTPPAADSGSSPDSADGAGAAVSSPGTAAASTSTSSAPAPAPTLTETEREEMGLGQAPPTAPDIQTEDPATDPEDDHGHDHGDQTHQHDDDNGAEDGGQADDETPPATETQTETATATTAPAADPNGDGGQEPPADNPAPEPDPEPVLEPDPGDWQDTAPVLEPIGAPDSDEIRNLHEYRAYADGNYVYLSALLCDPQPGFCNEQNQEYLALICVNPIGRLYPGLRIRDVQIPLRDPSDGALVWIVTFYRVKAVEDHSGNSVGGGRLQYVQVAMDRWDYQYVGETEPAEHAAWRDAFPTTDPHLGGQAEWSNFNEETWHGIVEVPGGHARDMGNRITLESEGKPSLCEGEYPQYPGT